MWLLESDGDVFGGKKLWLRPGKRYLFGRTSTGAGSFAIPEKTISRKHITIQVAEIPEGKGTDLQIRSTITVEDLETKLGTLVNGRNIRGERFDLAADENELQLANYNKLFRITWCPVVLSFTFTKAELQQPGVWSYIQKSLEPLDIKYTTEYNSEHTTHVVSKKLGNTSKILQALIDGKSFVSEGFIQAVVAAAKLHPDDNGVETSDLENDFEATWPKAVEYLPPRAEGPGADRPASTFAPNLQRRDIFEGYTFIFYEKKRFDDLMPVICNGKGKALLKEAIPHKTEIDDFIRYVKSIAGEKGLGEFEDGSEGRGVVVVRYVPSTGGSTDEWYLNFYNQVALRLDHRPIETRDFLPAILDVESAQLRRALEVEPTPKEPATQAHNTQTAKVNGTHSEEEMEVDEARPLSPPPPVTRRTRQRPAPKSRFKGFDHRSDSDPDNDAAQTSTGSQPDNAANQPQPPLGALNRSQRKRPAPERDIMDELAPTAAAIKRMRLEAGEDPLLPAPTPSPPPPTAPAVVQEPPPQKGKAKGQATAAAAKKGRGKKGAPISDDDFLNQFLAEGQEEEATLRAERELLQRQLRDGAIDFEDIRQGIAVETVKIRKPSQQSPERDQIERWDPRWNGLRNFKKFGRQGRQQPRKIIPLEPVKPKEFAVGGDYWLEKRRGKHASATPQSQQQEQQQKEAGQTQGTIQNHSGIPRDVSDVTSNSDDEEGGGATGSEGARRRDPFSHPDIVDLEPSPPAPSALSRSRKGKAAEKASQQQAASHASTTREGKGTNIKRAAAEPLAAEKPSKRLRGARSARHAESSDEEDQDGEGDEDDSEGEGLNFRFGKRK